VQTVPASATSRHPRKGGNIGCFILFSPGYSGRSLISSRLRQPGQAAGMVLFKRRYTNILAGHQRQQLPHYAETVVTVTVYAHHFPDMPTAIIHVNPATLCYLIYSRRSNRDLGEAGCRWTVAALAVACRVQLSTVFRRSTGNRGSAGGGPRRKSTSVR